MPSLPSPAIRSPRRERPSTAPSAATWPCAPRCRAGRHVRLVDEPPHGLLVLLLGRTGRAPRLLRHAGHSVPLSAKGLGYRNENASTINHLFIAACYLLPLLGGYVADNYLGKYWTIVGFSVPYIIGQRVPVLRQRRSPVSRRTTSCSSRWRCWRWAAASSNRTSRR